MVQAFAVWNFTRTAGFCVVPAGVARPANVHRPRLWIFCLSAGALSARMFLARRAADVESLQLLRHPLPRAMEHHAALPAVADLPDAPARMVVEFFLPAAFVVRRIGNVFPRTPL